MGYVAQLIWKFKDVIVKKKTQRPNCQMTINLGGKHAKNSSFIVFSFYSQTPIKIKLKIKIK